MKKEIFNLLNSSPEGVRGIVEIVIAILCIFLILLIIIKRKHKHSSLQNYISSSKKTNITAKELGYDESEITKYQNHWSPDCIKAYRSRMEKEKIIRYNIHLFGLKAQIVNGKKRYVKK